MLRNNPQLIVICIICNLYHEYVVACCVKCNSILSLAHCVMKRKQICVMFCHYLQVVKMVEIVSMYVN